MMKTFKTLGFATGRQTLHWSIVVWRRQATMALSFHLSDRHPGQETAPLTTTWDNLFLLPFIFQSRGPDVIKHYNNGNVALSERLTWTHSFYLLTSENFSSVLLVWSCPCSFYIYSMLANVSHLFSSEYFLPADEAQWSQIGWMTSPACRAPR